MDGHSAYLRHPPHQPSKHFLLHPHPITPRAYTTNHTKPSQHLLPFPSFTNWARPPAAVCCFCPFLLTTDSFGQFGCHGVDEHLVPMLRIENLEVPTGILQNNLTETEHAFRCFLVVAQKVEQSAHVPRGLLRLPACLVRAEEIQGVCEWFLGRGASYESMTDASSLGGRMGPREDAHGRRSSATHGRTDTPRLPTSPWPPLESCQPAAPPRGWG